MKLNLIYDIHKAQNVKRNTDSICSRRFSLVKQLRPGMANQSIAIDLSIAKQYLVDRETIFIIFNNKQKKITYLIY